MEKKSSKVPVFDLQFAAFQLLHGNPPELQRNDSRVSFVFVANKNFSELAARYNQNEAVPVLDFVSATRQLRAMMMALKGGQ